MDKHKFTQEPKLNLRRDTKFGSLQNEDMLGDCAEHGTSNPLHTARKRAEFRAKQKPKQEPKRIFQNWKNKKK